jgi:predicted  nucleic acid-binding Zn-ribbon protein
MNTLDYTLLTALVASLTAFLGWFSKHVKSKVEIEKLREEIKGKELDNTGKAIEIWKDLARQLETQVRKLTGQVEELASENRQLKLEIQDLRKTIQNIQQ